MLRKVRRFIHGLRQAQPKPPQVAPEVIQFPVNDICNSRCQMCDIWKQKQGRELSPEEVREIFSRDLFRNVKGVGINGGEPTLRQDLGEIVQAIIDSAPSLRGIYLITNAIQEERVIEAIDDLSERCRSADVVFDVMVSLDGVGEVHDRVRGIPGNFESACTVLDHLQSADVADSVRVGSTIIQENAYHVEDLLEWCRKRDIYARFRLGIPHQRLYNIGGYEGFAITEDQKYHVANFLEYLVHEYEPNPARRAFYESLRDQIIYGADRQAGCAWKSRGATLLADGGFGYCAVESDVLGNALEDNPSEMYWGNADHLEEIVETKCAGCMHDYDGISDPEVYLRKELGNFADERVPDAVRDGFAWLTDVASDLRERKRIRRALRTARGTRDAAGSNGSSRVLITGWYGTETLGDKAILGALLDAIRDVDPNVTADITSLEPYVTERTTQDLGYPNVGHVIRLDQAKELASRGRYEVVVMGGGPLMAPVGQCIDVLEIFARQKAAGGNLVVGGCGVGPLGPAHRNRAIQGILGMADRVLLRDEASRRLMEGMLENPPESIVGKDPAMVWVKDNRPEDTDDASDPILVALRDWPLHEYARSDGMVGESEKEAFEQELISFFDRLREMEPGRPVIPFCMHKHAVGGDDRFFYRRLFRERPHLLDRLDDRHRAPVDDLQTFASASLALTMRLHGSVFASGLGIPFLSIDYSLGGKVKGFAEDLGIQDQCLDPLEFDGVKVAERLIGDPPEPAPVDREIEATREALADTLGACM